MKPLKYFTLLIVLLSILLPVQSVRADVAPPPAPLLTGLQPFQYQNTKVQMVYERVEMEMQKIQKPDSEYLTNMVAVKASFVMHNQGKAPESMQAIFPAQSLSVCIPGGGDSVSYSDFQIVQDSFSVSIDGIPVTLQQVVTPHPYKDKYETCEEMHWVGFDVTFPVNVDVLVTVSYNMEDRAGDLMQTFDYILETGAAWYGPIQRAYVIVKFPFIVTNENVLEETTPGYQSLYNEIFWSFENLEPTSDDNIHISVLNDGAWKSILSMRKQLKENPKNPELWLALAEMYEYVGFFHGTDFGRSFYYEKQVSVAYELGMQYNPDNAELPARYADLRLQQISPRLIRIPSKEELAPIAALAYKTLALDPENKTISQVWYFLKVAEPDVTFTPPPTIPRTPTPLVSDTPTVTPSDTNTPLPSRTPQVVEVTVVQTRIVTATLVNTFTPSPTLQPSSTPTLTAVSATDAASTSNWLIGVLLVLAGFVGGVLVTRRAKA